METNGAIHPQVKRKALSQCFEEARNKFQAEYQSACPPGTPKRTEFGKFLQGTDVSDLEQICKQLGERAEKRVNNASQLWDTLNSVKDLGDAFISCAPESVSMVWFGIGSLIQIGNAKFQTQLLICGTCESIARIIIDCIRWEGRMRLLDAKSNAPNLEIWDTDIPDLIFHILDFLWSARPHFDDSRLRRLKITLKDVIKKEVQQKVDALLEKYKEIIEIANTHFQEFLLHERFQTGTDLKQIMENVRKFTSIGDELVDAVNRQGLLEELNHSKNKIKISGTHERHMKALDDHLATILKQRNGQPVAGWLFDETAYVDWESLSNKTKILYIKGPRGHGKSVVMSSVSRVLGAKGSLVCRFFFKKGEQDIQQSRTALESLLYQLLDSNQVRNDLAVLTNIVDIINPRFGDPQSAVGSDAFLATLTSLCESIRRVSEAIKERVYLFIDALDECQDRQEQNFAQMILSIVGTQTDGLRLVFSARNNIDILDELPKRLEGLEVVEITQEKNSTDLTAYLRYDVGMVLKRRIHPVRFPKFFDTELTRIVSIIRSKAKGDFTIARLIIASLQQPSKESLETKIQRLPASIGDIYMSSLESLTPDEQELVVVFLKWIVWSVSGMTVIEISDHYRELYKDRSLSNLAQDDDGGIEELEELPQNLEYDAEIKDLITKDPYENPDVKDIIHHLENAGRDFFKLDKNTWVVSVDISIREWIRDDPSSKSKIMESRGFQKRRDRQGNTVFKFTLTPSFVRYGESLNDLFVKREAQMSIALDILRTLNNLSFQEKYMLWPKYAKDTEGDSEEPASPLRYEIRHWQDHIDILQTWWNGSSSLDDPWWAELVTQISIFSQPENLQRWSIQVPNIPEYHHRKGRRFSPRRTYLQSLLQEPIHVACRFGLRPMIDYILRVQPQRPKDFEIQGPVLLGLDSDSISQSSIGDQTTLGGRGTFQKFGRDPRTDRDGDCPQDLPKGTSHEELKDLLYKVSLLSRTVDEDLSNSVMEWIVSNLDTEAISAWLALKERRGERIRKYAFFLIFNKRSQEGPGRLGDTLNAEALNFAERHRDDERLLLDKFADLIRKHFSKLTQQTPIVNTPDSYGRLPLYIAAEHPNTVRCLIEYGADANKTGRGLVRLRRGGLGPCPTAPELPLVSILYDLIYWEERLDDKTSGRMLQSAMILLAKTVKLEEVVDCNGRNLLQLAARIGDLELFKLLCLSGRWNVHAKDKEGSTPMHYLFRDRKPPSDKKRIGDILEICRIMVNMRQQNEGDLLNARNERGESPLTLAVDGHWVEIVRLLIELGADPHDEIVPGHNCFHILALNSSSEETLELEIAAILFSSRVDSAKRGANQETPLSMALRHMDNGKPYLVHLLIQKYSELGYISKGNVELLTSYGGNILHWAAKSPREDTFGEVIRTLLQNGIPVEDIQGLLLQVDLSQKLPIDRAINNLNFDAIQEIMAIHPDPKSWKSSRKEFLLCYAGTRLAKHWTSEKANINIQDLMLDPTSRLFKAKKIFNYLLGCTPAISFLMFETALFYLIMGEGSILLQYIDIGLITPQYGASFRDRSGWNLVDVLTHIKLEGLIDILKLKERNHSPPGVILKPSRIGQATNSLGKLSENGLEFNLPDAAISDELCRKLRDTEGEYVPFHIDSRAYYAKYKTKVFADHPVPPENGFYFEVHISNATRDLSDRYSAQFSYWKEKFRLEDLTFRRSTPSYDPFELKIGFKSFGSGHSLLFLLRGRSLILNWLGDGKNIRYQVSKEPPTPGAHTHYVGCGINHSQNEIFQTYNGVIQNVVKVPDAGRYTPELIFAWGYSDVRFNFGTERFQFEPANDLGRVWDRSFLDSFGLKVI
ncbi:hypothetical protein TWF569_003213 [Orbilia oligospora]|nr:hypothetical protein TWF569_003213 [Orbilia oligospora]